MPLSLRMQVKDIALYDVKPGEKQTEETLLSKLDLDFEVGPIALTSEDDYHRLLAALAQLKADSGAKESQVDLIFPTEWGVTHHVPDPSLSEEDLSEHLQWELRKALVDSEEKFRYNFAFVEGGGIALAALRISLLNTLQQVVEEAGFQLGGMFLAGDPWQQVNLVKRNNIPAHQPKAKDIEKVAGDDKPRKPKPVHPHRERRGQSSWFFGIVLVIGLVIISYFIWVKMSPPPEQIAEEKSVAEVTEAEPGAAQEEVSTPQEQRQIPVKPVSGASSWTGMSQRVGIVHETMDVLGEQSYFDLISFTDNRFLCQVSSEKIDQMNAAVEMISKFGVLEDVKTQSVPPYNGTVRGIISGKVAVSAARESSVTPDRDNLISLGKQHGLKNDKGLVFTGTKPAVVSFLNDLAAGNYAIYRVILLPWETEEYRAVLEL